VFFFNFFVSNIDGIRHCFKKAKGVRQVKILGTTALQDLAYSFWIVPRLSLSGMPSLAPLLPFLTSGPDLGAWPDCWVFVEFLYASIFPKGSGSTTTTITTATQKHY